MKKLLLISCIFVTSLGFGRTITGVGNLSEPNYGLVGLPSCGNLQGSIFTITGFELDPIILIGNVEINLKTFVGYSQFEIPNITSAGANNSWKLTGSLKTNIEDPSPFAIITVLSCPTPELFDNGVSSNEIVLFKGNDLDLVSSIEISVVGENLNYLNIPFLYNGNGTMNVTFPGNLTPGQTVIPTLYYPGTIGGIKFENSINVVNPPPPIFPPFIITMLGLNTNGLITIVGQNIDLSTKINYGGITLNPSNIILGPTTTLTFSPPTNKGLFAPYITVTNPSRKNYSAKWYFQPTNIFAGGTSLSGSSFDMFTLAGNTYGLSVAIPNTLSGIPSLLLHDFDRNLSVANSISSPNNALLLSPMRTILSNIDPSDFKRYDTNGDGVEEVVYIERNSLKVVGGGTTIFDNGNNSQIVDFDFGDFNGDGLQDIFIETQNGKAIYLKTPFSNYGSPINLSGFDAALDNARIIDINADGKADISSFETNNAYFSINSDSDGIIESGDFNGFQSQINYTPPGINVGAFFTDINNDGNLDFVALHENNNNNNTNEEFVFKYGINSPPYSFLNGQSISNDLPNNLDYQSLTSSDFNGDGFIDFVALANNPATEQSVMVYLTNNAGNSFDVSYQTLTGEALTDLIAADMNGDGGMDIVATNSVSGLTVFKNNFPCNGKFIKINNQIEVILFNENGSVSYKDFYNGSKPSELKMEYSTNGGSTFFPLTENILNSTSTITTIVSNVFSKSLSSTATGNYFVELNFTNIPSSFGGYAFRGRIINSCNTTISGFSFALEKNSPCPQLTASDFTITGIENPININTPIPVSINYNPQNSLPPINFSWFARINGNVSPLNAEIPFGRPPLGTINFIVTINSTNLTGATLFAVASYCGLGFEVTSGNLISITGVVNTCPSPLVVINPPTTTTSACIGARATLAYQSENTTTIQWQKSTDAGISWFNMSDNATFSGTNTNILIATNITTTLGVALFRAQFINTICGTTILGNPLSISIVPAGRIVRHPTNPSPTCPDNGIIMDATFVGNIVAYQWQAKAPNENSFSNITAIGVNLYRGFTTNELEIRTPKGFLDGYQYRLVAIESCGNISTTLTSKVATITIVTSTSPIINIQTTQVPICNTTSDVVKLSVTAIGVNMAYTWYEKIGTNSATPILTSNNNYSFDLNKPETLTVTNVDKVNFANRQYFVEVSGNCGIETLTGFTTSTGMQLQFYDKPIIVANLSGNCVFGESTLQVVPDTSHKSYQWLVDGKKITGINTTTSSYNLFGNGIYSVIVNNNIKCQAANYNYIAPKGDKATITTDYTEEDSSLVASDAVSYQWFVDGRFISGANTKRILNYFNGKFSVINTYDNECQSQSDIFVVSVPGWRQVSRLAEDLDVSMLGKKSAKITNEDVSILPNPSQGQFEVKLKASSKSSYIAKLFSLKGEIIKTQSLNYNYGFHSATFEVDDITPGIYQVQILGGNQLRWAKLVIY